MALEATVHGTETHGKSHFMQFMILDLRRRTDCLQSWSHALGAEYCEA